MKKISKEKKDKIKKLTAIDRDKYTLSEIAKKIGAKHPYEVSRLLEYIKQLRYKISGTNLVFVECYNQEQTISLSPDLHTGDYMHYQKDNSMNKVVIDGKKLEKGDFVSVNQCNIKDVKNDDIIYFNIYDKPMIRQFRKDGNVYKLIPFCRNITNYTPFFLLQPTFDKRISNIGKLNTIYKI